jgi:C4-dicarboxylate transporter|tara:strand:+ start:798 stop:1109 length:312 start_codon:yes stop_codon:yes gene_type:complete
MLIAMRLQAPEIILVVTCALLSGCSVVKAPIDLTTAAIKTTGKVVCATCEMTGDVASAIGSTASGVATVTRAVADVATSPAVQEVALESQGHIAKEIVRQAIK